MNMDAHESFNLFFRSKRDQYLVEIRKSKNENQLLAKRRKLINGSSLSTRSESQVQMVSQPSDRHSAQNRMNDIATSFRNALDSGDYEFIAEVAECIRRNISQDENPPLLELLKTNIVPLIIKLLDSEYFEHEKLMIECSWILTNIASGDIDFVYYLADLGIVPKTLNLLCHQNIEVRENAVWILANIAGENIDFRNQLLDNDVVHLIDYVLGQGGPKDLPIQFVVQISWLISLLLRGPPFPKISRVYPLSKYLKHFLHKYEQESEIIKFTLWSILYLSEGDNVQIEEVLALDCNKRIVELITSSSDQEIQFTCLKIVGNLLSGLDHQVQVLIDEGIIEALAVTLQHKKRAFRKVATWGLSNIMAGNAVHLERILNYKDNAIINKLFHMIDHDGVEVAREAIFCLTNACSAATFGQAQRLVESDLIEVLVRKLAENGDAKVMKVCLEGLECLLSEYKQNQNLFGDETHPALIRLTQCGGLNMIDQLQFHSDNDVYGAVSRIIENHLEFE